MAVEVDRAFLFEYLDERFEVHIAFDLLASVLLGLVFAGLDELLALECRDLHTGERSLLLVLAVTLGVLAVGHFEAAENLASVGEPAVDAHFFDGAAAELHVDGLPADDVAGAGHDVGGGDASGGGHADAGIVGLHGVEGANAALNGTAHFVAVGVARYVGPRPEPDVRMRVHEAGDHDGPFQIANFKLVRSPRAVVGPREENLPRFDDDRTVLDGLLADARVQRDVLQRERFGLRLGGLRANAARQQHRDEDAGNETPQREANETGHAILSWGESRITERTRFQCSVPEVSSR